MDKIELHKAVARTVTAIFGKHPRRVELDDTPSVPVVTIYYQPEILADHPEYRNNVRYYLFDRFATTDFSSLTDVNII